MNDQELSMAAIAYVKEFKKDLITSFIGAVTPSRQPVSIFMAGSPGAGKTEF